MGMWQAPLLKLHDVKQVDLAAQQALSQDIQYLLQLFMEHLTGHVGSVIRSLAVHPRVVPDLRPVGITGDHQEVGGLPLYSYDSQTVCDQLPLHPQRPHMGCWQVHSPSTISTFSFDGFVEFASCCNLTLQAVTDEVQCRQLSSTLLNISTRYSAVPSFQILHPSESSAGSTRSS